MRDEGLDVYGEDEQARARKLVEWKRGLRVRPSPLARLRAWLFLWFGV